MSVKEIVASIVGYIVKLAVAIVLVMFVVEAAGKAYNFGYMVFAEEPMSSGEGRTISIVVREGESVKSIGENLEEKGLIQNAWLFVVQEMFSEHHGDIQPGIYDLSTSMTTSDMLEIMTVLPEEEEDTDG